ncbi:MAG TPA: hypothetical protein V6D23_13095, partial [Candidatus Obscuribacterales bacterium]
MMLAGCQSAPLPGGLPGVRAQRAVGAQAATNRQVPRPDAFIFQQPVPVDVLPDRLIFTTPQTDIRPNQVLMGRSLTDQDFLRRATRLHAEGNRLIVETVPATLFEAFSDLDMAGVRSVRGPGGVTLQSHHFNLGGVVDIILDMNVKPDFSDAHLRLKDKRLFVRVAPRFEIDSQIRTEYTFFSAQAQLSPEPVLKPTGSISFANARYLAWVGPVPLVFHLKPGAA